MSSRYFANPFHSFGKADVNEAFYKRKILKCIEKIFDNLEPTRRNGKKGNVTAMYANQFKIRKCSFN